MSILGVIPVRYDSKRFPGKALFKIKGKALIEWVYLRTRRCRLIDRLIVATDDDRIAECAQSFGAEVFFSRRRHTCGTERIAEAAAGHKYPIVVNIQGDEISITAEIIRKAVNALQSDTKAWAGTVAHIITTPEEMKNPDLVKVVVDNSKNALYFSRCPIPCTSSTNSAKLAHYGHIGVYAFRHKYLQKFAALKQGQLEKIEKLEQLRILENSGRIKVAITKNKLVSINRRKDVKWVEF